jgi:hypothetical protein
LTLSERNAIVETLRAGTLGPSGSHSLRVRCGARRFCRSFLIGRYGMIVHAGKSRPKVVAFAGTQGLSMLLAAYHDAPGIPSASCHRPTPVPRSPNCIARSAPRRRGVDPHPRPGGGVRRTGGRLAVGGRGGHRGGTAGRAHPDASISNPTWWAFGHGFRPTPEVLAAVESPTPSSSARGRCSPTGAGAADPRDQRTPSAAATPARSLSAT